MGMEAQPVLLDACSHCRPTEQRSVAAAAGSVFRNRYFLSPFWLETSVQIPEVEAAGRFRAVETGVVNGARVWDEMRRRSSVCYSSNRMVLPAKMFR
jgi:hypothetical protein